MNEFILYISTSAALLFVIEGLLYLLFPDQMKMMMQAALKTPNSIIRLAAMISISLGIISVWLISMLAQ